MGIVGLLLWIVTIIIIIKDYKTESTRWIAAVMFLTGLGAFTVVFIENIMEYFIAEYDIRHETISLIYSIDAIIMTSVYSLTGYCILIYGLSYAKIISGNKKNVLYIMLFIPSITSLVLLPIKSNYLRTPEELMLYFRQLAVWYVPYVVGGIIILIYSYIKEKSYMMKKYKLLTLIIVVPVFMYLILSNIILRALGLEENWRYYAILIPIQFIGFLYFAFKHGVFGVRLKFHRYRFAFEDIFEFVSDSIITLDERLNVIEFNNKFAETFLSEKKKYTKFNEIIEFSRISKYKDSLISIIKDSKKDKTKSMELFINCENEIEYFEMHANPIILNKEYMGTVLVFKNITVHKKNLELIKQNQLQLIEKERLLSLNQLIGGIAHNLKTPLMSSAGGIQIINRNMGKIYEYIKKNCGEVNDVTKLVDDSNDWQERIKEYLIYMSDVITAVKGQVKEYSETEENYFSIKEIDEKITLLMGYQIKRSKCEFIKELNIDPYQTIKGDINSLIQVMDNLISNAIQASKEENKIVLGVSKKENQVVFYIKNFGDKISEEIQSKIFNEMVTTKGKKGTGLGLYISKSIINGRFDGEIYFETSDEETIFFVKIPLKEEMTHG